MAGNSQKCPASMKTAAQDMTTLSLITELTGLKKQSIHTWRTLPYVTQLHYLQKLASHTTTKEEFRVFLELLFGRHEYHIALGTTDSSTNNTSETAEAIARNSGILLSMRGDRLFCIVFGTNF